MFAAGPLFFSTYWVGLLTEMVILAILAMSLDILLGYTGLPSLGHAAFFGVAAYGVAVLATAYGAGFWACFIGGIVLGHAARARRSACIVSHVRDVYFLMITLALGMVLWGLSYRWIPVTGGDNGISGIPSLLEAHAGLPFTGAGVVLLRDAAGLRGVRLLMRLLVQVAVRLHAARHPRERRSRMKSLGFNTWLHCYLSYVISGAFASVAGVMWAYYNGFVSPTYLELTASSELFLMVTLGGPAR